MLISCWLYASPKTNFKKYVHIFLFSDIQNYHCKLPFFFFFTLHTFFTLTVYMIANYKQLQSAKY